VVREAWDRLLDFSTATWFGVLCDRANPEWYTCCGEICGCKPCQAGADVSVWRACPGA
jgi:hypothetical protein